MNKAVYLLVLLLVWLMVMVFAHDFVAARITADNEQTQTAIRSGTHDFALNSLTTDDVVESFQQHWHQQEHGLLSITELPEISINLAGFTVQPAIHQSMKIDAKSEQRLEGVFSIEFSNQVEQIYFDSVQISLSLLSDGIDLNKLTWTQNNMGESIVDKTAVLWSEIGEIDAWVIRFYPEKNTAIKLNAVSILQVNSPEPSASQLIDCNQVRTHLADCKVSNHMQFLDQSLSQPEASMYSFNPLLPISPWILILFAWLLTLMLVYKPAKPGNTIYLLLFAVFSTLFMLHQNWLLDSAGILKWFLLLAVLALAWIQKHVFFMPQTMAWPVWIISLIVGLLILIVGGFDAEILTFLPMYFLWACVQQLLIGPIFSDLFKRDLNTTDIITAGSVGVLFSIIHAPNHVLMLATLISGIAWSYAWLKYRNIYANAFSHALLALAFYHVMPDAWLGSARIGVFF